MTIYVIFDFFFQLLYSSLKLITVLLLTLAIIFFLCILLTHDIRLFQRVLAEIEKHEAKVERVLTKHSELHQVTGCDDTGGSAQQLKVELASLKQQATEQKQELERAVQQQLHNESEAELLQQQAEAEHQQMQATPIEAKTAAQLKDQLAKQKVWEFGLLSYFALSF